MFSVFWQTHNIMFSVFWLAHTFVYLYCFQCFISLCVVILCRQVRSAPVSQITRLRTVYSISTSTEPEPEQKLAPILGQILEKEQEREQLDLLGLRLCTGNATELRSRPGRIPEFLMQADCSASCGECPDSWRPVLYRVPVLVPTENDTQKYIQDTELVATACVCL